MSKIKIVCPNPAMIPIALEGSIPMEELYENLWMVDKQAYDACATDSSDRILMRCDTPLQLRYFTIVFQRFSAVGPDGLEFEPGKEYFFIGNDIYIFTYNFTVYTSLFLNSAFNYLFCDFFYGIVNSVILPL